MYIAQKNAQIQSFFLVRIFPYSVKIRENMDQKKTPYLDTFHVVVQIKH